MIAALSLACGDGGSAPNPDKFAGTWDATSYVFTNPSNTSQKVDVIALGATLVVVMDAGGTYEATLTMPSEAPEVTTGTWSASADVLTLKETGIPGETQFDYHLTASTLTISGGHGEFDFNGDDVPDDARISGAFVRQ
jgi:hypothetical protein